MKKYLWIVLSILLVAGTVCDAQAKRRKRKRAISRNEQILDIPLSEKRYQTDSEYWRAVQSGVSEDFSIAQKIAEQNCRQQLGTMVQSQIKSVIENYCRDAKVDNRSETERLYEELTRTIVNQQLNGITQAGQEAYRQEDGKIRFHICLQVSKKEMVQELVDHLEKKHDARLKFDKDRFQKTFLEEVSRSEEEER